LAFSRTTNSADALVDTCTVRSVACHVRTAATPAEPVLTRLVPVRCSVTESAAATPSPPAVKRCVPAASVSGPPHGVALTGRPRSRSAAEAVTWSGTIRPSRIIRNPAVQSRATRAGVSALGTSGPTSSSSPMPAGRRPTVPVAESWLTSSRDCSTVTISVVAVTGRVNATSPVSETGSTKLAPPACTRRRFGDAVAAPRAGINRSPSIAALRPNAIRSTGVRSLEPATQPVVGSPSTAAPARSRGSEDSTEDASAVSGSSPWSSSLRRTPGVSRTPIRAE